MNKLVLAVIGFVAFLLGYGALAYAAYPSPAPYGRAAYHGYFTNANDNSGTFVLPNNYSGNAFPGSVNNAGAFTNFILSQLGGNPQQSTGGAFIIQTMIGSSRNRPPTAAEQNAFVSLVNQYAAAGRVNWSTNYCYTVNTFYQGARGGGSPNDDAFFADTSCATSIVFTAPSGQTYAIRRQCANPVGNGSLNPLPPVSNWAMSASSTVDNPSPVPGATIHFNHFVKDEGPTATGQDIWFAILDQSGGTIIGGQDSGPYAAGQQKQVINNYAVTVPPGTPAGTQICERVLFDWATSGGGRNGLGNLACATVIADFNLVPNITIDKNGAPLSSGSIVEPGDSITFKYDVNNNNAGDASGIACNIYANNHAGYFTVPSPAESSGSTPAGPTCVSNFPHNTDTQLGSETVNNAPADTTICRSLYVNPSRVGGPPVGIEVCVLVANRPYFRVYGGDVSAGNPQSNAPGVVTKSAIVSWTKDLTNFSGAATQYAALAVSRIYDFSTTLGNAAGSANAPQGLAFANTSGVGDDFGGSFGSLPPLVDKYAAATGSALGGPIDIGSVASGSYTATGPISIHGSMGGSIKRIVIYVNGNVTINGNINYPTVNWTTGGAAGMPLLEIVVSGSIFIDQGVTNVDGLYVAQANGAAGSGTIYTCTNGSAQYTVDSAASFKAACANKLTINGSFVAKQVQLLRTPGTVGQSTAGEASGTNQAEVFNFSPALWMAQPPGTPAAGNYDSITSLPPIL